LAVSTRRAAPATSVSDRVAVRPAIRPAFLTD
jgi:hypothetical protein